MVRGIFGVAWRRPCGVPIAERIAAIECAVTGVSSRRLFASGDVALFDFAPDGKPLISPVGASEAIVGRGAIRNRARLAGELGLNAAAGDDQVLVHAYRRWGTDCCRKIYGDWCLAGWDTERRELFLARDHHGNSALYYQAADDTVAFATSLPLLLALKLAPVALARLYLGQVLVSWPAYHGEDTAYTTIRRVPPAHYVVVAPEAIRSHRYWRLEDVEPLRLATRNEYVEGLRDVIDRAVRECLPCEGKTASTLSSGLDSGTITATAARALGEQGRRIVSYVSRPVGEFRPYIPEYGIGDEWDLAQVTALAIGNVDLEPIYGRITPIAGLRRALAIVPMPQHAASNYYWLLNLYETAAARGCPVVLTGQFGNGGMSWTGDVLSQSLPYQLRTLGMRGWIGRRVRQMLPSMAVRTIRRVRNRKPWERTAIRPAFAEELHLFERRLSDPMEGSYRSPLSDRFYVLKPGRSLAGDLHAGFGAAAGIAVADPTADPRLLEYCFSVPDRVFIDPDTGMDRWLLRAAMKDRLPDDVRLNRRLGIQAADLVPRLRACRDEVEAALDECECGAAADYIDVPHMRRVWHRIETEDNSDVHRLAMTVLTRGIMAGLFANGISTR